MFSKLMQFIRQVIFRMVPYKNVEQVARVESPLSTDMTTALDLWQDLYRDRAPWLKSDTVKSLNLPAFICGEIARQMILELKWDITGPADENGNLKDSPRAEFLKEEFAKLFPDLRGKLEQGCGAGGLTIKPYPKGKHFGYDWTTAWEFYPVSFGDEGGLHDVIFQEGYRDGKIYYTRLERHTVQEDGILVTQRAFKSTDPNHIGEEVPLETVAIWAHLKPETPVSFTGGQLFGWYKVASANSVDINSPI